MVITETKTREGFKPLSEILIPENVGGLTECGGGRIYYVVWIKDCGKEVLHRSFKMESCERYALSGRWHKDSDYRLTVGTKIGNHWYVNPELKLNK